MGWILCFEKNAMKYNDVFPCSVLFLCLLVCVISQALGTFRYSTAVFSYGVFREIVSFDGVDLGPEVWARATAGQKNVLS